MRRTMLSGVILTVAVPTIALAQQGLRTQTAPHEIRAVMGGTLTFVPYGDGLFDVNSLGVTTGEVKGLGASNLFTYHRPTEEWTVEGGHFWIVAANGDKITGVYEGITEMGWNPINSSEGRSGWSRAARGGLPRQAARYRPPRT